MAKHDERADIKIRLTERLRAQIEKAAKFNGVSMNAEMVARLERSFTPSLSPEEITSLRNMLNKSAAEGPSPSIRKRR